MGAAKMAAPRRYRDERAGEPDALVPIEQETIAFYGHPIVAVRLADGRIGVILRWLCDSLRLEPTAQVRRVQRTEAIAEDLLYVRAQTDSGAQVMPAITLRALPFWLAGIAVGKVAPEIRPVILTYRREVVDVLYRHFAQRPPSLTPPHNLVSAEPIKRPDEPGNGALLEDWLTYHREMAAWLEWKRDFEDWRQGVGQWRDEIESRLESVEEVSRLVPKILERLGPQTLSPEHQQSAQAAVKRLHDLTGQSYGAIYDELRQAFHVGKYSDIPNARWPEVAAWLKARIERARKP